MPVHMLEDSSSDHGRRKKIKIEGHMGRDEDSKVGAVVAVTGNGTMLSGDGMMTPVYSAATPEEAGKDVENETPEVGAMVTTEDTCSCGYFHGPGSGIHEDVNAVGLSSKILLRGPD